MSLETAYQNTAASLIRQHELLQNPLLGQDEDYERIYSQIEGFEIGRIGETLFAPYARPNTLLILGGGLGDEGKGRFVDNQIESLLKMDGVNTVWVVRYQGGNNAGHSIEKDGVKLALHVVPSFVLHPNARGIMDQGEIIHPEDLQTEVEYIEGVTKESIDGRLFLSQDAILCSDLERAEEILNRARNGDAKGGTGRGIGPAMAHFTDKTGLRVRHLIDEDWEEKFGSRYDQYQKLFDAFSEELEGKTLAQIKVPDFRKNKIQGEEGDRTVGSKEEFLARLRTAREWLIAKNMVTDIQEIYDQIENDASVGIVFEGSQAAGLDLHTGTYPDVTSSITTAHGLEAGTGGRWAGPRISKSFSVLKATYTSDVGVREMPTNAQASDAPDASDEQKYAAWIQEEAHEYGTTTGRRRKIDWIDSPFLRANLEHARSEDVVVTHLDIAREDQPVKFCTHYTDKLTGLETGYKPYLADLKRLQPHYIDLPGWDGRACRDAHSFDELPLNAKRYLAFLQARLGYHIVGATTGPDRENLITFDGYL